MHTLMTPGQIAANPAAWLATRRGMITASMVGQMLGIAPPEWGGPFSLYHQLRHGLDKETTDEMEEGQLLEPLVLRHFTRDHPGLDLGPGGLYADDCHPWLGATFDGLAVDAGVPVTQLTDYYPVQAKTVRNPDHWGTEDTDNIPAHLRAQGLVEMHIAEAPRVFMPTRQMWTGRTVTFVIERDADAEADIDFIIDQAQAFRKRLEAGDPPPVDATPETTRTLRRLHPDLADRTVRIPARLARQYRAAGRAMAAAKARRTLAVNRMLEYAGDAADLVARIDGKDVPVASRNISDRRAYTVDAKPDVHRLNAKGWARE